MVRYEPFFEEASIVLVGSFNPAIFHPAWLSKHGLIQAVEADEDEGAKVEIVHKDLSSFSLKWLGIQVIHEKFIARTNDLAHFNSLRDLIISTFNILEHTPIKQLGMNRVMNFPFNNEEVWHKVGDILAPKNAWEKSLAQRIGLISLALESPRNDGLNGKINVRLEPSKRTKYGVVIDVNNHVELSEDSKSNIPMILSEHWEKAMAKALDIATLTLEEVTS